MTAAVAPGAPLLLADHEDAPCGYLVTRPDGVILVANRLVHAWAGRQPGGLVDGSTRLQDLLSAGSRIFHDTHYSTLMELQGFAHEISFDFVAADGTGERMPVLANAQQRTSEDGTPYRSITVFSAAETRRHERELVKARRAAEAAAEALASTNESLDAQNERLRVTLHSIADPVVTTAVDGCIESMNAAAEELFGVTTGTALGHPASSLGRLLCGATKVQRRPVFDCLAESRNVRSDGDTILERLDGTERIIEDIAAPILDRLGAPVGTVWSCRDVTARRLAERELLFSTTHDRLTGLMNRSEFERQIASQAMSDLGSGAAVHAMLFIALDQFQLLNDAAGHSAGDQMLRTIGAALKASLRRADALARLSGDTFGVLLKGCELDRALILAEQLRSAIESTETAWAGKSHLITASMGVAVTSPDRHVDTLLADAELACATAKQAGRNRCYHFEGQALMERRGEMHWISRIDQALQQDRFVLYFQPIVPTAPLPKGQPRKAEILLRMIDESGKLLSPFFFIPAAERYGKMQAIDRWVLRKSFEWMASTLDVHCSINVSGQSLGDPSFLAYAVDQLLRSGVDATRITFEITETAAVSSIDMALKFMQTMRQIGARFALDDFGAGLASFSYLKTFPVDVVKIDGSFVRHMLKDVQCRIIVESIQRIAAASGLQTVAEWVEDEDMLRELSAMGIDYAQGYATGRPMEVSCWNHEAPGDGHRSVGQAPSGH